MARNPIRINEIIKDMRIRITRGDYGTRGKIPSRLRLAKEIYHVSADTINKAVMHLQAEGFVLENGTSNIANPHNMRIPGVVSSFDEFIRQQGMEPYMFNVGEPGIVSLSDEYAEAFNLPIGTRAIRRLRVQGGKREDMIIPLRIAETFYLYDLVHELGGNQWIEQIQKDPMFNVIKEIKKKTGKEVTEAESDLWARFPDETEQELLSITYQTQVIEHWRKCYDSPKEEMLIMFNRIILKANTFKFKFKYSIKL